MKSSLSKLVKVIRWIPSLFIGCCSWILSSKSKVPMPDFKSSDKVVHLICFAGFSFFTAFAFFGLSKPGVKKWDKAKRILLPSLFVSIYGIIDEIHQSFVPGRSCSFFDWCADTLGAVIGAVLFLILGRIGVRVES